MLKQQTQKLAHNNIWAETRMWFILILAVSVVSRVVVALVLGNQVTFMPGIADQVSYHNLALRVLGGHGFSFGEAWWPATPAGEPTAHWSYLYTMYLVVVYALTGSNPIVARIIQAIAVGLLMPLLVNRLANLIFSPKSKAAKLSPLFANGERIGMVAAGITAVYFYFIYYSAALMTEAFYISSILWVFCVALEMRQKKEELSWRNWLFLGVALGVTVLLRQLFLLFIPFMLLWMWFAIRPKLWHVILPLAVIVLMILPWTIRNYLAFDYFVLLNTNSGFAFYWGNHEIYGTKFIPILSTQTYFELLPKELLHLSEAELDSALAEIAVQKVIADPWRYIQLSISRIPFYFQFWPTAESGFISNVSRVASFGLFLPFMLFGLWQTAKVRFPSFLDFLASPFTLLILFAGFYTGIHILTWTLVRYRLPVDAILIVFAGIAVAAVLEYGRNRFQKSSL
ncbi:MAG: hypothetical protein DWQ04_01540 [Chloroflexi bacterium]|nr:MAG: hypothetical protein DWQ04_01540 [Chloroflexota bacterium]